MLDTRGKQAIGPYPGHSGAAAASPTLHPFARALVYWIAVGFGRDQESQRAGWARAAATRGAVRMSDCPDGLDRASFAMGAAAWRRQHGVRP